MRTRDLNIIEFIRRHEMATVSVLHSEFFAGLSLNAVSQVTSRLGRQGYLSQQRLFGNEVCYRLGLEAIRTGLGSHKSQTHKLPSSRLIGEFAALHFCVCGEQKRQRLTPSEVAEKFAALPKSLRWKHPYSLLGADGQQQLGMVRAELGAYADSIVNKHLKSVYRYRQEKSFASLIDSRQFALVVVSPKPSVLRDLAAEIPQHQFYPACRLVFCGDLAKFLPQGVSYA